MSREDYEVVIGLEVHAELSTKTKIFCSCPTAFGAAPNTHTCPICMAMPGTLPVLNEKVVEYAVKAGLATNCEISRNSKNDRKNYFYPDLPKSYQISQFHKPLCEHGYVGIEINGEKKKIRLTRIHIEEDAGKLNHDEFGGGSLVDLNRAGVPLIETVSEPDIRSAEEAESYLRKLKSIFEYIEVSDCKMQEGSLRADVNVSVKKKTDTKLGTRTEMKNMNSFRSIVRAIEYEVDRQIDILEDGGTITQETLRWDDVSGKTFPMRDKEDAQDYRYFPDPDLVPIHISDEYLAELKAKQPEFKDEKKARYIEKFGLPEYDAEILTDSKKFTEIFEEATAICNQPKKVSNWIMGETMRLMKEESAKTGREFRAEELTFSPESLAKIITLVEKKEINNAAAKEIFEHVFAENVDVDAYVEEHGLKQVNDEGALRATVEKVIADNPQSVADYKGGKKQAIGYLVGQTMKAMQGKANPGMVNALLQELLK